MGRYKGDRVILATSILAACFAGRIEPDPPLDPRCPFTFDSPICVDANQDGGVDGFDVEVFFLLWNDGIRADFNRDGYIDTDYYQYDPPGSWCDLDAWFKQWQRGSM